MPYYVYILKSTSTGTYYIGSTSNVARRLKEHSAGKVHSTKSRRPYSLVYVEKKETKQDAVRREIQIKRYKGGRAFKELINSKYSRVV